MTLRNLRSIYLAILLAGAASSLAAQVPIYPGDPRWNDDPVNSGGTTVTTAANPYLGNASLELNLAGSLLDWGYYMRVAGAPQSTSWGLLSAVETNGFAWYRDLLPIDPTVASNDPFHLQSPVLRLLVRDMVGDDVIYSHLVWEYWYNQDTRAPGEEFAYGRWFEENLINQTFWRHLAEPSDQSLYTNGGCVDEQFAGREFLTLSTVSGWSACYSPTAVIWGVMVGAGSNWPDEFRGYVDHVQLGFAGDANLTVNDNFEFPPDTTVPEPATLVLLGSGLAGLAAAGAVRRRRERGAAAR
jgi:hypothetical protein